MTKDREIAPANQAHQTPEQLASQAAQETLVKLLEAGRIDQPRDAIAGMQSTLGTWGGKAIDIDSTISKLEGNLSDTDRAKFLQALKQDPRMQKYLPSLIVEELHAEWNKLPHVVDEDSVCQCDLNAKDGAQAAAAPSDFGQYLLDQAKEHFQGLRNGQGKDSSLLSRDSLDALLKSERMLSATRYDLTRTRDEVGFLNNNFSSISKNGSDVSDADLRQYLERNCKPEDQATVANIRSDFYNLRHFDTSDGGPSVYSLWFSNGNSGNITRSDLNKAQASFAGLETDIASKQKAFAQQHGFPQS